MSWVLIGSSIVCFLFVIAKILPRPKDEVSPERDRLMALMGFTKIQKRAELIGWKLRWRDYLILLALSVFAGYLIAIFTGNYLFVIVGVALCFFVPSHIISVVQQKRRKEVLLELPSNLRLLASKFRDCKSLQKSLATSVPLMSGVTKPVFLKLYRSLELGIEPPKALREIQKDLRFQKFDDLCEKLIAGGKEGFNTRTVDSIRETIEDINDDISLLKTLDIENKSKRRSVHVVVGLTALMPFIFAYMESQTIDSLTIKQPFGQILLVIQFLVSLLTYMFRDKYLSLNLKEL